MTAFSHNLIHNSITQSKVNGSIRPQMTAMFHTYGRLLHHILYMHIQDDGFYNTRRCTATTLNLRFIWWLLGC